MFYSIKWHHDQNQKKKNDARAAQLAAAEHPLMHRPVFADKPATV